MLRLTNLAETDTEVRIKVEGEVVVEWSELLETECLRYLTPGRRLVLDFEDVTLVDCATVKMLVRLQQRNLELINCSASIQDCIRECGQ